MILTATEVTILSNCSASVTTIINGKYIETVQERIVYMTNNYFVTDLSLQEGMTFNPSIPSIVATNSFVTYGFADGDEIYVYGSYRNDGYHMVSTVSAETLILASSATIYSELSGRSIMISVVQWPLILKSIAAKMVAYDTDTRPKMSSGLTSRSLGPLSESWADGFDEFGYPKSITDMLSKLTIARFF